MQLLFCGDEGDVELENAPQDLRRGDQRWTEESVE
jgi:hypothetical protein